MAIAFVSNVGSTSTNSGTTAVITVPAAGVASGHLVVVTCFNDTLTSSTLADSKGNTWTKQGTISPTSGLFNWTLDVYASKLTTALVSGDTITASRTVAGQISAKALEWSGVDNTLDGAAVTASVTTAAATWPTASKTTTNANDLVFMACMFQDSGSGSSPESFSPSPTGWTQRGTNSGTTVGSASTPPSFQSATTWDDIRTTTGTDTSNSGAPNWGDTGLSAVVLVAFKATAGGSAFTQSLTAVLSFTGAQTKANRKSITAALSFSGALARAVVYHLIAVLSFVGAQTKRTTRAAMAATLSFAGAVTRRTGKALTAGLSFTGAIPTRAIGKGVTGVLSFTGARVVAVTKGLASASLSFTGGLTKTTARALTAALSFSGALVSGLVFVRALTAALSFTGAQTRKVGKSLSGVLSFAGAQSRAVTKGIAAALSFTGAQTKAITRTAMTAALSFAGTLVTGRAFVRALTATLSFTGSLASSRTFVRALTATLNFAGSIPNHVIGKGVGGALSFTGAQARSVRAQLSGVLSSSGSLTRAVSKALIAAVLSFAGAVVSSRVIIKALTATLSFTGAATRQTSKALSATLTFVGSQSRAIASHFVAALTFSGSVARSIAKSISAALSFVGTLLGVKGGGVLTPAFVLKSVRRLFQFSNVSRPYVRACQSRSYVLIGVGMNITTVQGSPISMKTTEKIPWGFDMTKQLATGDTVTSPTVTLTRDDGTNIPFGSDTPSVTGNIITQTVDAVRLALTAGSRYTIAGTFTANTGKVLAFDCVLIVF